MKPKRAKFDKVGFILGTVTGAIIWVVIAGLLFLMCEGG